MPNNKKILLICYSFPPFPGIGGRRWAKFVKYLTKKDFEFFVLGAEHRLGKASNWIQDIQENNKIHYVPIKTRFLDFFHDHNFTFLKKIKYKLSKIYLEKKHQGNFYDKALASNNLFYKKAKQLITDNRIENVIITIAPNRLVDVGMKLKQDFPDINLIIDVRDPWNILLDDWDHKDLNKKQKAFELKTELNAAKKADTMFSVYQVVVDFYAKNHPDRKERFVYLPNGFDKDEINKENNNTKKSELNYFVYAGILYDISIHLFEEFLHQIVQLLSEDKNNLNNIQFHFYIPEQEQFKKLVNKYQLSDYVKFFNQVPLKEIQNVIANSAGCMLFLPPKFEFSLSTKFYEYVSYNKKILLFSNPGDVARIIANHNLGYVMLPGKMYESFKKGIKEISSGEELKPHTFNLDDYSIEKLSERIIPYLK